MLVIYFIIKVQCILYSNTIIIITLNIWMLNYFLYADNENALLIKSSKFY